MLRALDIVLFLLVQPLFAACNYLLILAVASRRKPAPMAVAPSLRFELVISAEGRTAAEIARTEESLRELDWPKNLLNVRVSSGPRQASSGGDATVLIEAGDLVSPNLLQAFAARLEAGAQVIQARAEALLPGRSFGQHTLRSLARERFNVSAGLVGSGMCFTPAALGAVQTLAEPAAATIQLGESGLRVLYAAEATVQTSLPLRSEATRKALLRQKGQSLVLRAALEKSPVLLDLALELSVPRLKPLILATLIGLVLGGAIARGLEGPAFSLYVLTASAMCLVIYGVRAAMLSGTARQSPAKAPSPLGSVASSPPAR